MTSDYLSYPSSSLLDCNVYSGNVLVGRLWRHGDSSTFFQYKEAYIQSGLPPLCLNMPFNKNPIASNGLHPFFCNFISEGWLEQVQGEILKLGYRVHRDELLARFGGECIGSIKLIPNFPYDQEIDRCFSTVAKVMASKMDALLPGVQPKLLVKIEEDETYSFPSTGKTSTHIVKLPFEKPYLYAAPENEYVTTLLMQHLLPDDQVCAVRLGKLGRISDTVIFIERFDRSRTGEALDFREFNQLLGKDTEDKYDGAYKDMADFIADNDRNDAVFRTDRSDIKVLYNRIIASILLGNSDTHLKNFGLLKGKDNVYRLSPNYDLLCCGLYTDPGSFRRSYDTLALRIGQTAGNISIKKLTPKHIIALGEDFGLSGQDVIKCVSALGDRLGILSLKDVESLLPNHYMPKQIYDTMSRRWNSTFAGVQQLLARREACSRAKSPRMPTLPCTTSPHQGLYLAPHMP